MVKGIKQLQITKLTAEDLLHQEDSLAVEEPLEIKIEFGPDSQRETRNLAITMRTPGADFLLASGFLFTEGIIHSYSEIRDITHCGGLKSKLKGTSNSVKISLQPTVELDFNKLSRHFYTTSSCGVCGKASIDLLETAIKYPPIPNQPVFNSSILYSLPGILRNNQSVFENTGGIHAAGLFDSNGTLIDLQEDVGRHNALDKLIGAATKQGITPLHNHIILLSGRVSFELVQKALMAGVPIIAAVGAPSSIAIELAEKYGMTVIGFLKNERCNIYCNPERIKLPF